MTGMDPEPPVPPRGVPPQEPQWRPPTGIQPVARDGRSTSFFVAIFFGLLLLVSGALNVLLLVVSIGSFAGTGFGGAIDEDGALYDAVRVGGDASARDKVLRIPIYGAISEATNPLLGAGGGTVSQVRRALGFAAADGNVRGILLEIDSPGGGVTDADEIYRLLQRFRTEHPRVRVLALFGDLAASGGYYVAAAAERIVARRTTLTGSIGVIMSAWNFAEAAHKIGVDQIVIKSSSTPYKDLLSPMRTPSKDELDLLQSIVDEFYQQFVQVVDSGRPALDRAQVIALANGAVYSGNQALANGLVDELGDRRTAEAWFRDEIGPVQILEYRRRPTLRDVLFGMQASSPMALESLLHASSGPRFLYYWTGAR